MFDISNTIAAFSEEHVERLTGLSKERLRYWDKTGFFAPTLRDQNGRIPFSRIYSFRDIVALRTLELLRVQKGVPLQHLRRVAEKLSHLKEDLWTKTTLWVLNRKVVFQGPGEDQPREVVSGQYVLDVVKLQRVISDTQRDVEKMRQRSSSQIGQVAKTRGIGGSAAVVAGTRIRADSVKRLHEDGYTVKQIIAEYPDLTAADVNAVIGNGKKAA